MTPYYEDDAVTRFTVDTTEAETQRILDDPKVAADVRRGLADIESDALYSFDDVFGEPQS